jgi:hypothetical protein
MRRRVCPLGASRTRLVSRCLHRASWEARRRWRELFMFSHGAHLRVWTLECLSWILSSFTEALCVSLQMCGVDLGTHDTAGFFHSTRGRNAAGKEE